MDLMVAGDVKPAIKKREPIAVLAEILFLLHHCPKGLIIKGGLKRQILMKKKRNQKNPVDMSCIVTISSPTVLEVAPCRPYVHGIKQGIKLVP